MKVRTVRIQCTDKLKVAQHFAASERKKPRPVSNALATNNIRGCGAFRFRENMADKTDFLVNCTADGRNWVSYRVSTARNKIEKLK